MAKTESTAINDFIELVNRKPIAGSPIASPIRISEPLDHIQTRPVAPIPTLVRDSDPTLYVEKPLARLHTDRPIGVPPPALGTPVPALLPRPPTPIPNTPRGMCAADVIRAIRRQSQRPAPIRVLFDTRTLVKILAMMVVAVIIGALCGRFVARGTSDKQSVPARVVETPLPAPAPAPAPAAPATAPVVTVIETPKPAPQHAVTVDFVSQPAGANVTLVSNGVSVFVGTTPVMAQVDANQPHDVVFTLDGHATKLARLAPATTPHLAVVLDKLPSAEHVAARRSHRSARVPTPTDDESQDTVIVSDE